MVDPGQYSLAAQVLSLKMTGQVGPRTFELLIAYYHTVAAILQAKQRELEELPGIGAVRSKAIFGARTRLDDAQRTIDGLKTGDTNVVTRLDDDYPSLLNELNDPPMLLFYRGRLPVDGERRAAVIGSQNVSAEGIGDAVELARRLAREGVTVVGGLARGIDTAGHMGALKENGRTCAVLPCGLDHTHPAENRTLAEEIATTGCLISEYLPGARVTSGRLLARNRLIVGLSQAVVIGEVSPESVGTLDSALCCQQLGKLLFVLIGKHNHHFETLVQRGAIPLTSLDDYPLILKSLV